MINPDRHGNRRASFPLSQAVLGVAFVAIGVLLLDLAFDSISMGRPITRAWVVAVAGVVLLIPGVAVTVHAILSAFSENKPDSKGPNGPTPLRFT